MSEKIRSNTAEIEVSVVSESVAHHIIEKFVSALAEKSDYAEVAQKLKSVVFEAKVTEADLRKAMFGEDTL